MDNTRISSGLGAFSIVLGAVELVSARRFAQALGIDHRTARIMLRAFGVREMVAGVGLLSAPSHSTCVWNRVAGDAMDLAALGIAARRAPRTPALWSAIAFVTGVTWIDALVAWRLDKTTGKMLPERSQSA